MTPAAKGSAAGPIAVLGVDPGPTTGIVALIWYPLARCKPPLVRAYQANADSAPGLLTWVLADVPSGGITWTAGGIEGYVRGIRSSRTKKADDSAMTIKMVHTLSGIAASYGLELKARSASQVKLWATDKRLELAGLDDLIPAKMVDARDGGRHALFTACSSAGIDDPLSWSRRKAAL